MVAFIAGILLVALFSRINIGVRHILPVYFGFSLLAAAAVVDWMAQAGDRAWIRWALAASLLWFAASSLLSHPDYLAYTNELAGSAPEKILADSDLDWGQDMKRLAERLRAVGATEVAFSPTIVADFEGEMGFPRVTPSSPVMPSPGLERGQPFAVESAPPGPVGDTSRSGAVGRIACLLANASAKA